MEESTPTEILSQDSTLRPIVTRHGPIELEPADDTFQRLITSIIRQQVSMSAATAIRRRLFETVDISPQSLARVDPETLTEAGLSRQKATYVQAVADAYLEHGYDRAYFTSMDDEEVIAELTAIRGIGDWTAKMFLLFCLGREDVFPVEDLGIRHAMHELIDPELTRTEMVERAEPWRPVRSYASLYLWRAID